MVPKIGKKVAEGSPIAIGEPLGLNLSTIWHNFGTISAPFRHRREPFCSIGGHLGAIWGPGVLHVLPFGRLVGTFWVPLGP